MKKHEYMKPRIKATFHLPSMMDSLSVVDDNPPIDDENEILSADDPLGPGWRTRRNTHGFDE
ncbi:MAG: hypothetical protein IKX24_12960 [Prevotella sp.]|jgi:hypothetical protein|nr:hypothetical protein [Prevotella sp.]